MSIELKIPPVGESITEVTLGQWLAEDGALVEMDQPVCEIESEKATFELNAEQAGILKHKANEGDELKIGDVVGVIEEQVEIPEAKKGGKKNEPKETPSVKVEKSPAPLKSIEMRVPTVGESITEVTLGSWSKNDGDFVEMDEVIAEIESDKATFELTAEASGILHVVAKEGESLEVGALICTIDVAEGAAMPGKEASPMADNEKITESSSDYAKGHPSPAAAKILSEKGLNPIAVQGTGPGGRITKEDALKAVKPSEKPVPVAPPPKKEPAPEQPVVTDAARRRSQRVEKMSTLRKTIAKRLVAVKNETAMLTTFNEVNMQPIMDIRSKYKEKFKEKYEIGLGFMSFFTKACCTALLEWPAVNAQLHENEIIYHEYCDISIAVSTPRGLVVPVIRNAESMSFDQIEREIARLAARAREGKLSIEEMQGGTFTITNGGVFGSMLSTPIINIPQSAILGMHNIVQRPVAENGEVVIRPVMYVALSYDHRIIDGRESVSFLVRVRELLEDPARLLLGI